MTSERLDRAGAILGDLIAFPSISSDSNLAITEYLATRLADAGARVEILPDDTGTKANLFATLGPDAPGGILLSAHTDVVPANAADWTSDPFRLREAGGRLYGRGTCDMKGFIAAVMATVPQLAASDLRQPVHFAFTYDEEVGCLGARNLVAELRRRGIVPEIALVGEPTSMRIIEGHKGCNEYTTRFTGTDGHGSDPGKGVNAAEYAARFVGRLLELRDNLRQRAPDGSRFEPKWSTINVGRIAGGSARNVIARTAEVEWEARPVTDGDADVIAAATAACVDTLLAEMRQVAPGATITTEVIGEVAGLMPMAQNPARDLLAALTGETSAALVPFGTEAGLFQSLGTSVVICGPGSIAQAHQPDEFLELGQLERCLNVLGGLARHAGQ